MTDRYHLIGSDVSASPSPQMVNAAFRELGVDAVYTPVSAAPDELARLVSTMRSNGVRGYNVTTPFKSAIIPFLDSLSDIPRRIGAVNTVKLSPDGYEGFNTDVEGIEVSLRAHGVRTFGSALVVGAGGAARAFVEAASGMGCRRVTVAARDPARASSFIRAMRRAHPVVTLEAKSLSDLRDVPAELVFNASPLGTPGVPTPPQLKAALSGKPVVFDAVYRPRLTQLLKWAEEEGCTNVSGHEMLLNQAVASVRIWTGLEPPSASMKEALHASPMGGGP